MPPGLFSASALSLQEALRHCAVGPTLQAPRMKSDPDVKDLYFTGDDYRYRIEIDAKRHFLELLKDKFNSGVNYKGKTWKWDTVMLSKAQELARFLYGKSEKLEFIEPNTELKRSDTIETRRRILELTQSEAKKLGIGKSTLHYLRKRARN